MNVVTCHCFESLTVESCQCSPRGLMACLRPCCPCCAWWCDGAASSEPGAPRPGAMVMWQDAEYDITLIQAPFQELQGLPTEPDAARQNGHLVLSPQGVIVSLSGAYMLGFVVDHRGEPPGRRARDVFPQLLADVMEAQLADALVGKPSQAHFLWIGRHFTMHCMPYAGSGPAVLGGTFLLVRPEYTSLDIQRLIVTRASTSSSSEAFATPTSDARGLSDSRSSENSRDSADRPRCPAARPVFTSGSDGSGPSR